MHRHAAATPAATALAAALVAAWLVAAPVDADPRDTDKTPTSVGFGGAVSTVDPEASRIGLEVLRKGGNAVDAAVAAAAALGVTEPYSAGVGGGGYFVHYDAATGAVETIDGRETAPAAMPRDAFIDLPTGQPYRFTSELVTSGVSVGVPGTPATWQRALERWGPGAWARRSGRRRGWPTAASSSTRPSASRPWTTRRGSRRSRRPVTSTCRAATRPSWDRSSRIPSWPRPTA